MINQFFSQFRRFALPIYPLLFGLYPVLYLWGQNRAQEPAYVVIPSLLMTLLGISVAYLLVFLLLRNIYRAAFVVFVISSFVLTYGHAKNLLAAMNIAIHNRYLFVSFPLLLLFVFLLARKYAFVQLAKILNPVSVLLVFVSVLPTGYYYIVSAHRQVNHRQVTGPQAVSSQEKNLQASQASSPDVYFILMDAYSREDLFQSRFHFDNRSFINALQARGFVLPNCAQSNYPATTPTITSILNMDYLDHMGLSHAKVLTEAGSEELGPYIQENIVFQKFLAYGYKLVTFRGFLSLIDLKNVDDYVDVDQDVTLEKRLETINFQNLYLQTTALYGYDALINLARKYAPSPVLPFLPVDQRLEKVYQQNIYAINTLKKLHSQVESPKLVYAHLYASHWPYLILPDGSPRQPFTEQESDAGYLDGVQYLNNNMLDVIDSILANAKTPPVIILQSDHGYPQNEGKMEWSGKNRLKNFSAYYLPSGGSQMLSDKTTPVNNFRMVLKYYLHEDIDLLPDVSYYVRPDNGKVETAPATCISASK